jgi:hypothetical protein
VLLLAIEGRANAQSSVLKEGSWAKFSVTKNGVYKITYDLIKKAGFDPGKIDPTKIRMHGIESGMLPQANSAPRPNDLPEIAIYVSGESDGKFDKQDYVLFYAQHPDKVFYDVKKQIFNYQKNIYSDRSFYFLTVGDVLGKRAEQSANLGTGYPPVNTFNDFVYYELEDNNLQKSGRDWAGEYFGFNRLDLTIPFTIEGIQPDSEISFASDVIGTSSSGSTLKISINNNEFLQQKLFPISGTQYGVKGLHKRDTIRLAASSVGLGASSKQEIKYSIAKDADQSRAYLDKFILSVERKLALYGDQTIFTSRKSTLNSISQFEFSSFASGSQVWDVSDPYNVKTQEVSIGNSAAIFSSATGGQLKNFIVFNAKVPTPDFVERLAAQDLHGMTVPNFIIVTHPTFLSAANRLADHRRSTNNYTVEVVTTEQVFNEFSGGRQDVSAIRDFMKLLYDKAPYTLKSLLLFGKGSYDYKNILPNNTNFVCTYESRNSLHPLLTYSSDDYFGFLENSEGEWAEEPAQNHTLEIGVGRFPVTSLESAESVVDKIVQYETSKKALGHWRKEITFIADDGNDSDGYTSLHESQADQLAQDIESLTPQFDTKKLFIGTYPKQSRPGGEFMPELADDIVRTFYRGALIINYTGHGGGSQLADENIINTLSIEKLENKLYPFLVTATCEFGRNDNPQEVSGAERLVTRAKGGAIGMVTTARPVNATTNFDLNQAFYEALFDRTAGHYQNIGEVFRRTKNNSVSGVANRNFSLLGDPSLTLALPSDTIKITSLKTKNNSDTLKALSTVIVHGEIRGMDGILRENFNGTVQLTLFDHPAKVTTSGRNNPPFSFNQFNNALFRGQASVVNGKFETEFILPAGIQTSVGLGKLSLYAFDPTTLADASGGIATVKIGGKEVAPIADNVPPQIEMFMSDTTFANGGITQPNTTLVVKLKDNTAINVSSYDPEKNLIATLDDNAKTFVVNDYFIADADDMHSGRIAFPLTDLAPGSHRMFFRASDIVGNTSMSFLDFVVSDNENLVIQSFGNYPNPFIDYTTLFFTHNRSGDDLQAQLLIQSLTGELIKTADVTIPESDYEVKLLEFNPVEILDKKLPAGLYLARLIVRSLTNGSKNEQVTKLIILN